MRGGIRADLVDQRADAGAEQLLLQVLLGIGVDGDGVAELLQAPDPAQEIGRVADGPRAQRGHAVGPPRRRAGHQVFAPGPRSVEGLHAHALGAGALAPFFE